jgi:hypothetical protein
MATGAPLSLMDVSRRTDPDGEPSDIAELLSQANEIYDDLVWKEGNTNTGHVYTVRTGIPAGTWRYLNQGVPVSKSTTAQGRINCGMLEAQSTIDIKLLEMADDENKFRYEEDNAFFQGMSQTIAGQFVYGNALTNPASFTGFEAFYNTVNPAIADNAANVFDGGGAGSNNTSLLLIAWNPRSIYAVYPKGSAAGLKLEPLDYVQVAYDGAGNPFRAKTTWFRQEAGFCVEDWRWGVRAANLDVTSAGLGGPTPYDIFAHLSQMVLRLPKMGRKISNVNETDAKSEMGLVARPAIYANRTLRGFMDIQAIRDKNVLIGMKDFAGEPVETYRSVPVRILDQLKNTETRVV